MDHPAAQKRVVLLCLPDAPGLFHRVDAQALVRPAGAAVQLLDAVQPPLLVRCVPPHRERLGKAKVEPAVDLPVFRDGERCDHMGPALVFVAGRVVAPFGKHLPGKAVPAAVEQRLLFCFRHTGKACKVAGVVCQQGGVIKNAGRDEHPRPLQLLFGAVRQLYRVFFGDRRAGRCRRDEPCLHPPVADAAGIGGGPHVHPGARAGGTVAAHHVAVLFPFKVGQLVKADKIEGLALIIGTILGVLHGAKVNFCPAGEVPHMGRGVVLCLRERPVVVHLALVHQIRKLRVGLAQDQRPVVRNVHLPQRFDHQRVALSAACCTAVQRFRFRAAHKFGLPRLGPPDHRHSCLYNAHGSSSTVGSSTTPHSAPSACAP